MLSACRAQRPPEGQNEDRIQPWVRHQGPQALEGCRQLARAGREQKRLTESTDVRCYPDKKDPDTEKVLHKDTRGKAWLKTWRDRLIREAKLKANVVNCRTTVYDYSLDFIRMKELSGSVTTDGYRCYQKHLLGTELGGTPMCEVTPRLVQDWEGSLLENGLHANTVSHIHVFLKMVFTRARKIGDLPANPFDLVETPKRRKRPANSLTRANGKYFLSSPKSESSSRSIPFGCPSRRCSPRGAGRCSATAGSSASSGTRDSMSRAMR